MTKIEMLYNLYTEHPEISSKDAAEITGIDVNNISVYRQRLKDKGVIDFKPSGSVIIVKPYHDTPDQSYKSEIYREMVDAYMDDFRGQSTFADRLAVGREIRLLLERM